MKVWVVVSIIIGDAKSGDAICGHFGGKNCVARATHLCMMPFTKLNDPMCDCHLVRMSDMRTLYNQAANPELYLASTPACLPHMIDAILDRPWG